jgi:hypothetical protein
VATDEQGTTITWAQALAAAVAVAAGVLVLNGGPHMPGPTVAPPDCRMVAPTEEPVPDFIGGYVGANLSNSCVWASGSTPMTGTLVTLTGGGQPQAMVVDESGCFWFAVDAPGPRQITVPGMSNSKSVSCDSDASSPKGTINVDLFPGSSSWDNHFGYK